jgi:uncharacterized protein
MSARRASWSVWCADLFGDADLKRIAAVHQITHEHYPRGLLFSLKQAPPGPVIYTGALENQPGLLAKIDRPVWGNSPGVLRAIRSSKRWTAALQEHGLHCPAISDNPQQGAWLLKPRKSGGGFGIHHYSGQAFDSRTHFLQEWIEGVPCSAVFLGMDSEAVLIGVTRQIIGASWLNATGFHYAGNVGPLLLNEEQKAHWQKLGTMLTAVFQLRGLFGIDAVVRDGDLWPVEVNPRYTASVEIFERSGKTALLPWHRAVFDTTAPADKPLRCTMGSVWGKAILYARERLLFPAAGPWLASLEDGVDLDETEYADIPHAGDIIEQGRPVLTLFASAATVEECVTRLQHKAQALDRCLWR